MPRNQKNNSAPNFSRSLPGERAEIRITYSSRTPRGLFLHIISSASTFDQVVSTKADNRLLYIRPESFPMSTAFDARRRPSLWSYLSFSSKPRRRSISLPKQETTSPDGKENTSPRGSWGRPGNLEGYKEASMTGGQRARLLKTGGVIAFVVLLLYLFTSRDGASVGDIVKGSTCMRIRTSQKVAKLS